MTSTNAPTVADLLNAKTARAQNGNWVPASNGTEVPFFTRSGHRLLYCYQPATGRHAYLNVETDLILSDEEASTLLAF